MGYGSTEFQPDDQELLLRLNDKQLNKKIKNLFSITSNPNLIGGGNFDTNPWQRGTTFAGVMAGGYMADRWVTSGVTDGFVTVSQGADSPSILQTGLYLANCYKVVVTTADNAIAAGQFINVAQTAIEGKDLTFLGFGQAGQRYLTLSFWVKATVIGIYCINLRNSAVNRSYIAEYVVNTTLTWEYKVVTIPVDITGTWLYTTGAGIYIGWCGAAGSTFQTPSNTWTAGNFYGSANQVNMMATNGNIFELQLVKAEGGQIPTSWRQRSIEEELSSCQRYYYRNAIPSGFGRFGTGPCLIGGTDSYIYVPFPVTMRTPPTAITQSGTATDYGVRGQAGASVCNSVPTFITATIHGALVHFGTAAGPVVGECLLGEGLTANAFLAWSADL